MTAGFFGFLFFLPLVTLGTASPGRKGQWQAGPEEIVALRGPKHLGCKPPLQRISFQLYPGKLLLPFGKRSLQGPVPPVTCHHGGSHFAYPPSPQPLFTSRRGLDDFSWEPRGAKDRCRWPPFCLSSLNFHCFPAAPSGYFSSTPPQRWLEIAAAQNPQIPTQARDKPRCLQPPAPGPYSPISLTPLSPQQ